MLQSDDFHTPNVSSESAREKLRFGYLDGMRGAAALYVVLFHIYFDLSKQLKETQAFEIVGTAAKMLLSHGKSSVAIFIVLSGYCLMIPVAKASGELKGGIGIFFKRRALRILPTYYVALLFSLLLTSLLLILGFMPNAGRHWNLSQEAFSPGAIISHLLLIHNLFDQYMYKINPPMWSVALEWQIYFLFPFLLLPVWRRFGSIIMLTVASLTAFFLHGRVHSEWFIVLFAMGMIGANVNFSNKQSLKVYRENIPWNGIANFLLIVWIALTLICPLKQFIEDLLLGLAFVCLMISCSHCLIQGRKNVFLRFFSSKWMTTVGTFSYSLYLTHSLTIAIVEVCLSSFNIGPDMKLLILISTALPASLLFAYKFYLAFEKPFMSVRSKYITA